MTKTVKAWRNGDESMQWGFNILSMIVLEVVNLSSFFSLSFFCFCCFIINNIDKNNKQIWNMLWEVFQMWRQKKHRKKNIKLKPICFTICTDWHLPKGRQKLFHCNDFDTYLLLSMTDWSNKIKTRIQEIFYMLLLCLQPPPPDP